MFHVFDGRSGLNTFDAERAQQIAEAGFKVQRTIELPVTTVSEILDEYSPDIFPDLLSVDVEGLDLEVLASIDYKRSAPKLICVEANSVQERHSLTEFLESNEYALYFRAGANLFFLRTEFLPALRA